jgi:hypothetical protein
MKTSSAQTSGGEPQLTQEREGGRVAALAARIGCTEGQVYSMVISLAAASLLVAAGGVPLGSGPPSAAAGGLPTPAPVVVVPPPTSAPSSPAPLGIPLMSPTPFPGDSGAPGPFPRVDSPTPVPSWSNPFDFRVPPPGAPAALVADTTQLFVGTDNASGGPSMLMVLSRTGQQARVITITGQPASRVGGLSAAARWGSALIVTDRSRGALLRVDPRTGEQHVLAQLPDLPPCGVGISGVCQPGFQDQPPSPEGVVVTPSQAYVTDSTQGIIWRYSFATRQLAPWYNSSDFATGKGPSGLAVDSVGDLVFSVAETLDPAAPLMAAVYRLGVAADGTAGTRTLLASFAGGSQPGPLAFGRGGNVYVGLRSAGGVSVIDPDGKVSALAGASTSTLRSPRGLSLINGLLYVADAGQPATNTSGSVKCIPVDDAPLA